MAKLDPAEIIQTEIFIETSIVTPVVEAVGYSEAHFNDNLIIASWLYQGGKNNNDYYIFIGFDDDGPTIGHVGDSIDLKTKTISSGKSYKFDKDAWEFSHDQDFEAISIPEEAILAADAVHSRLLKDFIEYDDSRDEFVLKNKISKDGVVKKKTKIFTSDVDQDQLDWIHNLLAASRN